MDNDKPVFQMTLDELKVEAEKRGIPFTDDVKRPDLMRAVSEFDRAKAAEGENAGGSQPPSTPQNLPNVPKPKQLHYYLFTNPTFVDDDPKESVKLFPAGLYQFDRELPRLAKVKQSLVRHWVGTIQPHEVVEIAESVGMKPRHGQVVYSDLLQKLLSAHPKF